MRRVVVIGLIAALGAAVSGCGDKQPPLAGGKPVSYWVQALQDPDAKVRKQAAFKLGNVGSTDPLVVPALMEALKDRDAVVRCEAILALLKCGPEAKDAIPTLTELERHDPDPQVRTYAGKALAKVHEGK